MKFLPVEKMTRCYYRWHSVFKRTTSRPCDEWQTNAEKHCVLLQKGLVLSKAYRWPMLCQKYGPHAMLMGWPKSYHPTAISCGKTEIEIARREYVLLYYSWDIIKQEE